MLRKNVFIGENSLYNYLNPENVYTPLVELPKQLNPYYNYGVRIFAKLLNTLPLNNVKSIPAFSMLSNSNLSKKHTIIENSSGNTVLSLAVIGRILGINQTKAFVSNEVTLGKLKLLQLFGVEPIINKEPICPNPNDKTSGIYKAIDLGKQDGWLNLGQYNNENNPKSHYSITGPQIYQQTKGNIQIFCAGLGTTGTAVGTSRYLKEQNRNIHSIGVARKPNNPIPGPRTRNLLSQIAFKREKYTDSTIEIGTKEAYLQSLNLIRNGLVVGPSSGFALSGLFSFIKKHLKNKTLDLLKNKEGNINAVFICCDSPYPYIDEYFTYLDDKYFPQIENEDILLNKYSSIKKNPINKIDKYLIQPEELFDKAIKGTKQEVEVKLGKNLPIKLNKNWILFDIRTEEEFFHFHIPGSKCILEKDIHSNFVSKSDKKVVFICSYGIKSIDIVNSLRSKGYEAYSLKGGITEWSNRLLPRWKPSVCYKR